jgi:hypothetical protein
VRSVLKTCFLRNILLAYIIIIHKTCTHFTDKASVYKLVRRFVKKRLKNRSQIRQVVVGGQPGEAAAEVRLAVA